MKRAPITRKRKRNPALVDSEYIAWLHAQPCAVAGSGLGCCGYQITTHHVRRFGSARDDRRAIPLCKPHHLHDFGVYSVERLGKRKFELAHAVDLEQLIAKYRAMYEEARAT